MLPHAQQLLFVIFALVTGAVGVRGFYRVYRRIAAGRSDTDERTRNWPRRIGYALATTLTQSRTFRKRPWVSFFHSFIFYGFTFYLLVNFVDAIDGFHPLSFRSLGLAGNLYVLFADVLSALVFFGVVALVIRRFALPSRRDFSFNPRTLLHPDVKNRYVTRDSIVVSSFILFHVGSRAIGAGAKLAVDGPDRFAPFATLLSHLFSAQNALAWRIFGYWGALGSVLLFLAYFPYSKHIHIFMTPVKYLVKREASSGVMPMLKVDLEADEPKIGAAKLEDLAWPRLLDAYACVQCNRCQAVCPATATGKALSPSALEINKRMELNTLARTQPSFETGAASPHPLLSFALSPEAAWGCTTCGACIEVCPVGDEPMLDILDIRREQVLLQGEFPAQLQSAFRGMERTQNPWGINRDKRLDWAEGLAVKTTDENPEPDVLFWVGCAAAYDPQSQKTARAFVQLLNHAEVDFAVLGKRECCTGDPARRAGNEVLYQELGGQNVATLNRIKPKLVVATCPHCLNAVGKEYKQLGGDYQVVHHTQFLESLVAEGRLTADKAPGVVAYHDPCYLGRHNGVYDAPRNVLNVLSNAVTELPRNRENSFCCGAGGAQFWKEEEPGEERIAANRLREVDQTLNGASEKVLAVGCPFCKSMLGSTPAEGAEPLVIKDVAELLLEGVQRRSPGSFAGFGPAAGSGSGPVAAPVTAPAPPPVLLPSTAPVAAFPAHTLAAAQPEPEPPAAPEAAAPQRKSWAAQRTAGPIAAPVEQASAPAPAAPAGSVGDAPVRKAWSPQASSTPRPAVPKPEAQEPRISGPPAPIPGALSAPSVRKAWAPKAPAADVRTDAPVEEPTAAASAPASLGIADRPPTQAAAPAVEGPPRKTWSPKAPPAANPPAPSPDPVNETTPHPAPARKVWTPKAPSPSKPVPGKDSQA